jgi:hypothetical protein
MTYSNASPLMAHGKNQQGLRWLRLSVLEAVEVVVEVKHMGVNLVVAVVGRLCLV